MTKPKTKAKPSKVQGSAPKHPRMTPSRTVLAPNPGAFVHSGVYSVA